MNYRIFDVCVDSDISLPGLPSCEKSSADWTIRRHEIPLDDSGFRWFQSWAGPGGESVMRVARFEEDYLLEILELAAFRIRFRERLIEAFPRPDCTADTLAHFLADQVLPRVLCHAGQIVLHASAVVLADGRMIAFTGPSGRGKSTLATAFLERGCAVASDDCLMLESGANAVHAWPSYPSLRLWEDSAEVLIDGNAIKTGLMAPMAQYSSKNQVFLQGEHAADQARPLKLSALCLLDDPTNSGSPEAIRMEPAGGHAAIMGIIEALFALDPGRPELVSRNFKHAALIAGRTRVFALSYARNFGDLPAVVERVMNNV